MKIRMLYIHSAYDCTIAKQTTKVMRLSPKLRNQNQQKNKTKTSQKPATTQHLITIPNIISSTIYTCKHNDSH